MLKAAKQANKKLLKDKEKIIFDIKSKLGNCIERYKKLE
jgi:hypothetical protein